MPEQQYFGLGAALQVTSKFEMYVCIVSHFKFYLHKIRLEKLKDLFEGVFVETVCDLQQIYQDPDMIDRVKSLLTPVESSRFKNAPKSTERLQLFAGKKHFRFIITEKLLS